MKRTQTERQLRAWLRERLRRRGEDVWREVDALELSPEETCAAIGRALLELAYDDLFLELGAMCEAEWRACGAEGAALLQIHAAKRDIRAMQARISEASTEEALSEARAQVLRWAASLKDLDEEN